jgi:hypothetical protein
MRMLKTLDFADAGVRTGTHRAFVLQRNAGLTERGDIGLTLAEARQLLECVQNEFVAALAASTMSSRQPCATSAGSKVPRPSKAA